MRPTPAALLSVVPEEARRNTLVLRELGIDSYREAVIFMRADCHLVVRSASPRRRACA